MRLDRLEIHGFKSFADRTVVEFNPGMTAIVGPNGCGKTNITDAIRWVLGEQRPTALRGSSMQEVIFNGTRERKALGMCEVTLTFANSFGLLPVEYSEVAVTRRVFRDGESEYFLNRAPCYLKDIRDLFMGTGVGASAYSLIEGRMVDAILSDKADERRQLFEEAAGVTRYKARRRATLRKLEATESDLQRLQDLLTEVRRTTGSLRRQVGRARRFAALQRAELRLAVALAQRELAELDAREGPLREHVGGLEEARRRGELDRTATEAEVGRLESALAERRAFERDLRSRLADETARLHELERAVAAAGEGERHARSEAARLDGEIAEHDRAADELAHRRAGLAESLAAAREAAAAARAQAEDAAAASQRLSASLDTAQAAARAARAEHDRLTSERLRAFGEQARAAADREAALARRVELEEALGQLRPADGGDAGEAPHDARRERDLEERVAALTAARAGAEDVVAAARAGRMALAEELAETEGELGELTARRREAAARLDTLEELRDGFAGFGEGARRALEARDALGTGLRGPLGLEVEIADARHELAVEAYLDLFLDAVVTADDPGARAVIAFWRERQEAGAVWPLDHAPRATGPALPAEVRARVLCRGTEAATLRGELDRHRESLFGRLLLVEDLERALEVRRLLNANGGAGWYVVAALTGEIVEPSGIVRLPHRKEGNGKVSRFHQAEVLRATLEHLRREEERAAAAAEALRERVAEAARREEASAAELTAATAELDSGVRERERVRGARTVTMERAAALERDLLTLAERIARDAEAAEGAAAAASEAEAGLAEAEHSQAAAEARVEALRVERDEALHRQATCDVTAEQRLGALAAIEREERWLEDGEAQQRQAAFEKETQRGGHLDRAQRLAAEAGRLELQVAERRAVEAALRHEHGEHEGAIATLEETRAAADAAARAARSAFDEAGRDLHVEEMRLADLLHRRDSIRTVIETEFGRPLEELAAEAVRPPDEIPAEDVDAADETEVPEERVVASEAARPAARRQSPRENEEDLAALDVGGLRERLRAVREKKTALGPVNLLALQEFETEKERQDFLEGQTADLVRAREDLREAIRKINATARELFSRTFEAVQVNFRATFGTLFEGGTAEISLADPADPLESDIEISASPRGKRVQVVNLLSGGERALTALSLLFAIYLVKPSPFCILDEVDAPLDDANIGRFLRMLKSFSDRTQFIVVTHNKRTMEAADFLYGVTMEEPGVSTLVSVDFERRHGFDPGTLVARRSPAPAALVGD